MLDFIPRNDCAVFRKVSVFVSISIGIRNSAIIFSVEKSNLLELFFVFIFMHKM